MDSASMNPPDVGNPNPQKDVPSDVRHTTSDPGAMPQPISVSEKAPVASSMEVAMDKSVASLPQNGRKGKHSLSTRDLDVIPASQVSIAVPSQAEVGMPDLSNTPIVEVHQSNAMEVQMARP